jgi:hypothetical protein
MLVRTISAVSYIRFSLPVAPLPEPTELARCDHPKVVIERPDVPDVIGITPNTLRMRICLQET